MKVALLSNVTVDHLSRDLEKLGHQTYVSLGYNAWALDVLNTESALYAFKPQVVFVLLHGSQLVGDVDGQEAWRPLQDAVNAIQYLVAHMPEATIFVSTLDFPPQHIRPVIDPLYEKRWEMMWLADVEAMIAQAKNMYVFDVKSLVEEQGRKQFYSSKMWYFGGMPYSSHGLRAISQEMVNLLAAVQGKRLKAVALDLDNTLWGGVIGEDGLTGILLSPTQEGARYADLQKRLVELKQTGAILLLLSKNNPEDALEAIDTHPDMVLRQEHLAGMRINWLAKPDNLAEMITELNIGLDAVAFLDDNPVEREQMRVRLPDVQVLEFPSDTATLAELMMNVYRRQFLVLRLTEEDQMKTEMYQAEHTRREVKAQAASVEDYLLGLDIEIDVRTPGDAELERVAQMTQKTNQFNLTTRRYTVGDIRERMNSPLWRLFVVRSRDKYGEDGVTLLFMARRDGDVATIDTLLLSCRVMGRLIEQTACEVILQELFAWGCTEIRGEFLPTRKNSMAKDFYSDLGFNIVEQDDAGTTYVLNPGEAVRWPRVHKRVSLDGTEVW